jgi:nitrogen regulatory protein PII
VVSVIRKAAHTGKHGDGKIAVSTIDRVVDIRSDTEDEAVL